MKKNVRMGGGMRKEYEIDEEALPDRLVVELDVLTSRAMMNETQKHAGGDEEGV